MAAWANLNDDSTDNDEPTTKTPAPNKEKNTKEHGVCAKQEKNKRWDGLFASMATSTNLKDNGIDNDEPTTNNPAPKIEKKRKEKKRQEKGVCAKKRKEQKRWGGVFALMAALDDVNDYR